MQGDIERARARILADGFYGPVDDDEWEQSEGYRMTMAEAMAIVKDDKETKTLTWWKEIYG